jgi:hypothetical protein
VSGSTLFCKSTNATRALRITGGGQAFCGIGDADFAENSLRVGVVPTSRTRQTGLPASYSRS